jgi:hypothetical protein
LKLVGIHFDTPDSGDTIDVSRILLKIIECFVGGSTALKLGSSASAEVHDSQIGSSNTGKSVDLGLAASLIASNTFFEGWVDASAQVGARFSHCTVDVNKSGGGTAAIVVDELLDGASFRFVNGHIHQRNSSGHGVRINSGASEDCLVVINSNHIRGDGGGTAVRFVDSASAADVGGIVIGNVIDNWSTGIDADDADGVLGWPNKYTNVSTHTARGGGAGTILDITDIYSDADAIAACEAEDPFDHAGDVTIGGTLTVDIIDELSGGAGVTAGGVLLKDAAVAVAALKGLTESGGQEMAMGAVADGEFLKRSGATIVGETPAGGGTSIPEVWAMSRGRY